MTCIAKETVIIHILGQNIEKDWIDYVKIESLLAVLQITTLQLCL